MIAAVIRAHYYQSITSYARQFQPLPVLHHLQSQVSNLTVQPIDPLVPQYHFLLQLVHPVSQIRLFRGLLPPFCLGWSEGGSIFLLHDHNLFARV